ncbi:MAG: murein biosynthesis integral membrane protein MurJ [Patescibacteria group bacterium]
MVRRVFNLMYREVRGLHQAAYILALFALGSQVLAIVRDRLLAHTFGAGIELDLYYAAFRVPDLLFVLFASVLSIYVLLPFVHRHTELNGVAAGTRVLSQVFTLFLVGYTAVAGLLAVVAPWYVPLLFPGLAAYSETLTMLLRILLLQPFLLGLSTLCGVVTQMNHRFVLYAISPLLYNIGIIIGVAVLYPIVGLAGLGLGVVLGALGHLLVQVPFVRRSEFRFRVLREFEWGQIKEILQVSIPRALTMSINQLVLLVLIGMATVMTAGSVSVFQFAFNLQSVPLAVIGMSYSVAAFPTLSHLFASNDQRGFNQQLLTALRHIIFWSIPVIGLIIVLRAQLVRVLLGSGAFDWSDTRLTAAMLAIFVLSLTAQAALLLLVRAFYAGGRTFIPLVLASLSGALTLTSAIFLQSIYQTSPSFQQFLQTAFRLSDVPGAEVLVLALAFMAGQCLQLVLLLVWSAHTFQVRYRSLGRLTGQAMVATLMGMLASYLTLRFVVEGINQETFMGVLLQGVTAGVIGVGVVVLVYWSTGARELREISRSFKTRLFKTDVIAPQ